jgi:hypothetical protein
MSAASEFLGETNGVFGFFFDVQTAGYLAIQMLDQILAKHRLNDSSDFIVGTGEPKGTPAQEIERSLHSTTVQEVKRRMADAGSDQAQAARHVVVFVFHLWDEKYRAKLAAELGRPANELAIDILGDLRLLRNSIIHNKGVASADVARCKIITRFKPGDEIALNKEDIHLVIRELRAAMAAYA